MMDLDELLTLVAAPIYLEGLRRGASGDDARKWAVSEALALWQAVVARKGPASLRPKPDRKGSAQ